MEEVGEDEGLGCFSLDAGENDLERWVVEKVVSACFRTGCWTLRVGWVDQAELCLPTYLPTYLPSLAPLAGQTKLPATRS